MSKPTVRMDPEYIDSILHWLTQGGTEKPDHDAAEIIQALLKRVEELERELETYKEFKVITDLTIENERFRDELDRERSDCAELDQENERLKQELEELEDR